MIKPKILIFTDSRGEFKKSFSNKLIFTEKIKLYYKDKFDVELMLCPFKWTTTLDFLDIIDRNIININDYKYIILYTGIVEYSPRPLNNAIKDLYNNIHHSIFTNKVDYIIRTTKIINNKKQIFDKIFTEQLMTEYLNKPFNINFEKNKTINMYSCDMMEKYLIPRLNNIHNLIFINSNKILNNWDGNYLRGRPRNINIISTYSKITNNKLNNVINLLKWSDEEIKTHTIDNMHLTYIGSEYIFNKLKNIII